MFNNKENSTIQKSIPSSSPSTKLDTLIGQKTVVNGDISFNGVLSLDGKVKGSIRGTENDDVLTISESGIVEGKIEVANLIINGTVKGDIIALGKIEVASLANIEGNVYYQNLEMDSGSKINGQLIYQDKDNKNVPKPVKSDTKKTK